MALPPACWSTFWKSNFKQQLGCGFDIMDNKSYFFCVFWHMQLYIMYMSWYIRSFSVLPSQIFFTLMPPPLGAWGIMFSGCLSVRPSVRLSVRPKPEIPSFDLYMGPLVHPTNRNRFTACPSVRRGFRAFAGECMEGLAWNFTCWCILTIFRTD